MEKRDFHLPDHDVEARLGRLRPDQAQALAQALETLSGRNASRQGSGEGDGLPFFLLPLAEFGLSAAQMIALADTLPEDFPLDHRAVYFDFRLRRWIRHIEPPTIAESLEEYMESAETPAEGIAYLKGQWQAFLRRHGA